MKKSFKIIISILIISIIFVVFFIFRNDIKFAYDNNFLQIKSSIEDIIKVKDNLFSNNTDTSFVSGTEEVIKLKNNVNISGPLKVFNDYISPQKNTILSKENIIILTNKERATNGSLPELKENSKLSFSAEIKLQDMFAKQYFEHISPSGIGVGDLGDKVSYEYITIGENLAMGDFKDDKTLIDAWMASSGHRANILNKKYTEIGVAVARGKFEGRDVWIAVQHFGLPKSACPSIDEVLHEIINRDQEAIKTMGADLSNKRDKIESGVIFEGKTISEQIDIYNSDILNYNKLISEIKDKIIKYNEQVQAFNSCISINSSE